MSQVAARPLIALDADDLAALTNGIEAIDMAHKDQVAPGGCGGSLDCGCAEARTRLIRLRDRATGETA